MAFNLQTWREQCKAYLKDLKQCIADRKVDSIYGTIAAAAVWPVIAAFQQGDLSALVALGQVLAGVGTNLLASGLQSWRDQAEVTRDLQARIEKEPALREELDTIVEKLDAIALAKAELPEKERQWFVQTLQQELQRLGNLSRFQAAVYGAGAIAQGENAAAVGARGALIEGDVRDGSAVITGQVAAERDFTGRDKREISGTGIISEGHVVIAKEGATVVIGEMPVQMDAVDRESALGRYLEHVIARNRYLQLQGIRSGGRLVHIELEQIYVTLRATQQRTVQAEEKWLNAEAALAPGEWRKLYGERPVLTTETVTVSVNEAMAEHRRLVVLGDPGSGKTTLLRHLALLYARDLAQDSHLVMEKLGLHESGALPVLLPLRQIGAFLQSRHPAEDGTEGHALLLEFLYQSLKNERIELPRNFFDSYLQQGQAVVLLDGLDEVADPDLRRRVAHLVEAFTRAYPSCRFLVTSRVVAYTGTARLGESYVTTTVRDFTLAEVERFLNDWHRLVAMGQGLDAKTYAQSQTRQLMATIRSNERIRELAINPLILTVIALVHRDRVKLPDRRAVLYAEAVDVLLDKWEEAKGVREISILANKHFDADDKRLLLQSVALHMHENQQKEITAENLRQLLGAIFVEMIGDEREAGQAVTRFLQVTEERTGLLAARGEGIYTFSYLSFQEYLTALAIAARDDYVDYTMKRTPEPWWREVILLEADYLSTQSKERTTRLIRAIAEQNIEPEPYHNLVLAAECLRDIGSNRVQGDMAGQVQRRLRIELETPPPKGILKPLQGILKPLQILLTRGTTAKALFDRRIAAAAALARIGGITYWTLPHGEPEWVEIPAGEFLMGSEEKWNDRPIQKVYLDTFLISRVPITNAQYYLFVQATEHLLPKHWLDGYPPKGKENHPVTNVYWYDAVVYCQWLSQVTGKTISLPNEAQWERAARGDKDLRVYPWGDTFDPTYCNCEEIGLSHTTPVGIFPNGASPYGILDMSGNVSEWTSSLWGKNMYRTCGGDFNCGEWAVRIINPSMSKPYNLDYDIGFRVVAVPVTMVFANSGRDFFEKQLCSS